MECTYCFVIGSQLCFEGNSACPISLLPGQFCLLDRSEISKMPSQVSMNFGELSTDADFTSGIKNFHDCVNETGQLLQNLCEKDIYEKLDVEDRVKYDLFLSYSLNSLYWLYLRTEGVDPSKHALKSEIDRTKEYFARAQQVQDRKTIMPRINKAAAHYLKK